MKRLNTNPNRTETFKFRVSPTAEVPYATVSKSLGDVRIEGWIKAEDTKSGLHACTLIAGLFGLKHAGGFSSNGQFLDFPFCFEVFPASLPKHYRCETQDELLARVQKTLRFAGSRLTRERNKALAALES